MPKTTKAGATNQYEPTVAEFQQGGLVSEDGPELIVFADPEPVAAAVEPEPEPVAPVVAPLAVEPPVDSLGTSLGLGKGSAA